MLEETSVYDKIKQGALAKIQRGALSLKYMEGTLALEGLKGMETLASCYF